MNTATDIAKSINLLDAFHMVVNAWKNVKLCGEEELDKKFFDWVDIDANEPTSAEITEEDILLAVQQSKETETEEADENEEEEPDSQPPPTANESRRALQIIRTTLEQRGATCDDYDSFYDIERKDSCSSEFIELDSFCFKVSSELHLGLLRPEKNGFITIVIMAYECLVLQIYGL
ncbi:hypothetical protein JTE90_019629 [Oedothorax gibbosus]|uniref:DDE-1 domain-containing protein n=1 Tax=Oedothorax gibbosus TaxID=931172 RepID=A0AAV6TMN7_9ARAC|nr:hypothetical protein JTE90_019629 [Oedothorax gibbosus]